jgi:hypothetical protein
MESFSIKLNTSDEQINQTSGNITEADVLDDESNDFSSQRYQEPADGSVVAEFGSWRNYVATTPYLYRYFKKSFSDYCKNCKSTIVEVLYSLVIVYPVKGKTIDSHIVPLLKTKTISVRYKLKAVLKEFSTRSPLGEFRSLTLLGDLFAEVLGSRFNLNKGSIGDYGEHVYHINQQSFSRLGHVSSLSSLSNILLRIKEISKIFKNSKKGINVISLSFLESLKIFRIC